MSHDDDHEHDTWGEVKQWSPEPELLMEETQHYSCAYHLCSDWSDSDDLYSDWSVCLYHAQ